MRSIVSLSALSLLAIPVITWAEGSGGKSLASTMDVYVFPKEGQVAEQQSKDEYSCYEWATTNTGSDPFELNKQSVAEAEKTEQAKTAAEQTGKGAGVRGALRGAAAGAVVGEIVDDDASDGAEIGAAAGAISARRKARKAREEAKAKAEQQGEAKQQATEQQLDNFKKAFSVCLEAKDYMVKY
jgi:hypothetical protein